MQIKGRWFVVEVIFHNETDYNQFNLMSHFNQITILKPDRQGQRHEHDDLRITLYDNNNLSNHIKGRISDISSGNMMAFITNKGKYTGQICFWSPFAPSLRSKKKFKNLTCQTSTS